LRYAIDSLLPTVPSAKNLKAEALNRFKHPRRSDEGNAVIVITMKS
jgi:hypothetical protein